MRRVGLGLLVALSVSLAACGGHERGQEHYTSPKVEGASQRINLDEVQKAFWDSKGKDFNQWMGAFEKRVNEICDGKEVLSVDAKREEGHLVVTGFVDKNDQEGFQSGDDKLFTIEQTGDAVSNEIPYRVSGGDGRPYYEGHHSLLDNPFLQWFLISHMMSGWGGRYSTPHREVVILRDHRDSYRQTPAYQTQQTENKGFFSRFKRKATGDGIESTRKFGSGTFSQQDTGKRRSWFGTNRPDAGSPRDPSVSGWGGHSSSGGSSWGGRRSSWSSGGSSWGSHRSSGGWGGRRRR